MITEEQRKKYLKEGGVNCPFCGSEDIEGGHIDIDAGGAWQHITCLNCEKRWNDMYVLTDVEEVE